MTEQTKTLTITPEISRRLKAIGAAQWRSNSGDKFVKSLIGVWSAAAVGAALRGGGWSAAAVGAALRGGGWSADDVGAALRGGRWSADDVGAALRGGGWSAAAVGAALRGGRWSADDVGAADESAINLATFKNIIGRFEDLPPIPKLEKPYSRLLAEIEAELRCHDQSTFGPAHDPKQNLRKTRMCTAGHLVNLAGPAGYKLLAAVSQGRSSPDFETAALLIHFESCPAAPPQNFGAISQDLAMAYIAQRALEENLEESSRTRSITHVDS